MRSRRLVPLLLAVPVLVGALVIVIGRLRAPQPACEETASCRVAEPSGAGEEESAVPAPPSAPAAADGKAGRAAEPPAADAVALRDEADRLIREGKVLEGLDVFRKAVEADPSAKNHGDLGSLLYRLTALDEAGIHLRAAAELDPGNADRWIALANLYYRKVDLGEAWKAERRAREAEPGLDLGRDRDGMRVRKGDTAPRIP